jgi:hypothetical protein
MRSRSRTRTVHCASARSAARAEEPEETSVQAASADKRSTWQGDQLLWQTSSNAARRTTQRPCCDSSSLSERRTEAELAPANPIDGPASVHRRSCSDSNTRRTDARSCHGSPRNRSRAKHHARPDDAACRITDVLAVDCSIRPFRDCRHDDDERCGRECDVFFHLASSRETFKFFPLEQRTTLTQVKGQRFQSAFNHLLRTDVGGGRVRPAQRSRSCPKRRTYFVASQRSKWRRRRSARGQLLVIRDLLLRSKPLTFLKIRLSVAILARVFRRLAPRVRNHASGVAVIAPYS